MEPSPMHWKTPITITIIAIITAGCSSFSPQSPTDNHVRAYLEPYSPLILMNTEKHAGMATRDWVASNVSPSDFNSVILSPVSVASGIERDFQITSETLTSISQYMDKRLIQQIGEYAAPPDLNKSLKANVMIVGLETKDEAFRYYEYLPIGILLAGGSKIVGIRDEEINLFILTKLSNAKTGEVFGLSLAGLVAPERLENRWESVTLDVLEPVIDKWVRYQIERINRYQTPGSIEGLVSN